MPTKVHAPWLPLLRPVRLLPALLGGFLVLGVAMPPALAADGINAMPPLPDLSESGPQEPHSYFLYLGDRIVGPVTLADITALLRGARINGQTLVWREGMEDWVPASQAGELAPLLP